jgi:hypothetical protein
VIVQAGASVPGRDLEILFLIDRSLVTTTPQHEAIATNRAGPDPVRIRDYDTFRDNFLDF